MSTYSLEITLFNFNHISDIEKGIHVSSRECFICRPILGYQKEHSTPQFTANCPNPFSNDWLGIPPVTLMTTQDTKLLQSQLKFLSGTDVAQEVKRYQKSQGGRCTAFHASEAAAAQLSSPALRDVNQRYPTPPQDSCQCPAQDAREFDSPDI